MSEARFESVMRELRATAPPAPDPLRERVRSLQKPQAMRGWRLRPALLVAVGIAVAVGLGAAAIGGLTRSSAPEQKSLAAESVRLAPDRGGRQVTHGAASSPKWTPALPQDLSSQYRVMNPALTPGSRLQQYDVSMNLRVRDLSRATQTAVRKTRGLGGYVAAANYSTGSNSGDSSLDLRVPVQHVQQAIASFTDLGTILSQHISVVDLQARVDSIDTRLAAERKVIAQLEAKATRTDAEQARLEAARRSVKRLSLNRAGVVSESRYAKISLQLTTRKAAAKHVTPGRFSRFWGDAGDILGKEAIAVLYALVVAGPFLILAALALFGGRARRRRSDHRLLEETG